MTKLNRTVERRRYFTSPQRGEAGLRSNPGEGTSDYRGTVTPHPALRADLSLREEVEFADASVSSTLS